MNTLSRRTLLAAVGATALFSTSAAARIVPASTRFNSCGAAFGTPEIKEVDSDIPFSEAYLDTTMRYHQAIITLTDEAMDDIDDDRILAFATDVQENFPLQLTKMGEMRKSWYGSEKPGEATTERMLIAIGGLESCTDQSHMDFLDENWVKKTYKKNDDKLFAYVSMMVLAMDMEMHQHMVAIELAKEPELLDFAERMHTALDPQITLLKAVRGELITRP